MSYAPAIEVERLVVVRSGTKALDAVSLTVASGDVTYWAGLRARRLCDRASAT